MRIERTYSYEGDVARVLSVVIDPAVYEDAAIRSKALSHEVTTGTEPDGRHRIVLRRALPTDQVPSFAQGFVGPSVMVVETTHWNDAVDGRSDGGFDVVIEKAPVTFRGVMTLEPPGGVAGMPGTVHTIAGELKAAVPFLGKKIEESLAPVIIHQLDVLAEIVGTRLAVD